MAKDINSYNLSFLDYLEERKIIVSSQREEIKRFVEDELVAFIKSHIDNTIVDLYHCTDPDTILRWRDTIFNRPILSQYNASNGLLTYQQVLILYRDYLLSNVSKLETQGEEDADDIPASRSEGELQKIEHITHKRSKELRDDCITYWKLQHNNRLFCACCGLDFEKAYGAIGEGYIEIHHLYPISQFPDQHEVNPKEDLVPLCSNCHSMAHAKMKKGYCRSLDELKSYYKGHNYLENE